MERAAIVEEDEGIDLLVFSTLLGLLTSQNYILCVEIHRISLPLQLVDAWLTDDYGLCARIALRSCMSVVMVEHG